MKLPQPRIKTFWIPALKRKRFPKLKESKPFIELLGKFSENEQKKLKKLGFVRTM